ncbi:restriction endonuclease subunit S [Salmonella enterica]|nr:restriction endonuclease subunit S [Salmonella enterica]MIG95994.1 restriction endonuclease subunit S [Salmonella enterica]
MARDSLYPVSVKAGKPILGMLPTGWQKLSLEKCLNIEARKAYIQDNQEYDLVTVKRSRGGVIRREHLKGKDISVKSQFYIKEDDFLISKRQIVHGACGLVPKELSGSIVSNEYCVLTGKSGFYLPYMEFLSESLYFQQTCFHSSIGVHIEKMIFKLDSWFKWPFNIPPLSEQKRIVKILSTWDNAISVTENLLANSQQQKKALMQQLLTGKKRLLDENGVRFSGEWRSGPLGSLVGRIYGGGTPSRANSGLWGGDIPWVTVKDLISPRINGAQEYINEIGLAESASNLVLAGTVIIATRMAVGKTVMASCDVAINQDLKAICASEYVCSEYIFNWFLLHSEQIAKMGTGSTVKGVQVEAIKALNMTIPKAIEEQQKIASVLSAADAEISILEKKLACLKDEKKALMQQLLTGKRRVKVEAEEAVSA